MKRHIKACLLVFCFLFYLPVSGCYDKNEVDEMAYVVSMGIDNGENGNLRLSLLLAIPIAVGVGPEAGDIGKSTTLVTAEAPTIYGGINLLNSMRGKQLNFSHAKLIILSKEVAMEGIEKYINTFIRFREFRPHMFFGISRGKAELFLKETKPLLEVNPAKFYELLMVSGKYTGFSVDSTLEDFYMRMECTCNQPVAALMDINDLQDVEDIHKVISGTSKDEAENLEGNYLAGEVPIISENKLTNMGVAVFRADKMVGELNGRETINYLMVSGRLEHVYYSMPEPKEPNSVGGNGMEKDYISLRLSTARKPVIHVEMKEDKPNVFVDVSLEGDILSIDSDEDYATGEDLKKLEDYASMYIAEEILRFLNKTRDVFKSDICAIGKSIKKKLFFWKDWMDFKWMDKYEQAEFEVSVKVSVRRSGVTIKQVPVSRLKGDTE